MTKLLDAVLVSLETIGFIQEKMPMIFTAPLPFIKGFIDQLDQGIRDYAPRRKLSKAQRWWLSFCLMGILLSNSEAV